jgi:TonB family protein
MSGPSNLDLFTLAPSGGGAAALGGGVHWGRLYAALAISCLLHAALVFMPGFGASSSVYRPDPRGAQESGPARALDVRFEQGSGPAAEAEGPPAAGAGPVGAPAPPSADEDARPPQQLSRGIDLLPGPGPAFHTAEQLTKRPEPTSQPMLDVPRAVARTVRGRVALKLWIDELGNVVSVEVDQSNVPKAVSDVAVEAFGKLRYEPGEINGRRVPAQITVEVTYDNRLKRP